MVYRFGRFALDGSRFELRENGEPVPVEPQVLSLLFLFAKNPNRLIGKEEILDSVWNGRIVSESALSSRIKAARRAVGDDGATQQFIRTIHGKGFRFESTVEIVSETIPAAVQGRADVAEPERSRPSIAVLPLRVVGDTGTYAFLAEALAHEIIVELSRLRWLFVIARGSSFQFTGDEPDLERVSRVLGARYCLTGVLERLGDTLAVAVELADTRHGGFVWCERFEVPVAGLSETRADIVSSVVSALEIHIPEHEADRARLTAPERLDAWSNYHLGLRHMYRFNKADNAAALQLFTRAAEQEPHFARGFAALSFTRFQNAFLNYTSDAAAEALEARRSAERALLIDERDPAANVAMGRSLWLTGELDSSLRWLDRGVHLGPNYAQGIYARAWTETLIGDGAAGQRDADLAAALSPIDPLHYAMIATRALSNVVRGDYREAAHWADRAARDKGAHVLIAVIAAACQSLGGDSEKAAYWAGEVRRLNPHLTRQDFFRSFPFADAGVRGRIARALEPLGI